MSAVAPAPVAAGPGQQLLAAFMEHSRALGLTEDALGNRLRSSRAFLADHPDLGRWMARPLVARLADLRRTGAWPLVGWAILVGRIDADIDLLLARRLGGLSRTAETLFPGPFAATREAAERLAFSPTWTKQLVGPGLSLALAFCGSGTGQLTAPGLDALARGLDASQVVTGAIRAAYRKRLIGLRRLLYEARILDHPAPPARQSRGFANQLEAAVAAPEICRVMLRYLETRTPVLRPGTLAGLANDLACFGEFLAARHPGLTSLTGLERSHVEEFCSWVPTRPWRGDRGPGRRVSASASAHSVITLRSFLDDIAAWGWAECPARRLVFASDIPRQPRTLPRALPVDVDAAVMAAVAGVDDLFVHVGLTVLRGTGLRIGELIDLELDCVVDYGASGGSWLRVPLGKLDTERSVPLDEATLGALDAWMAHRGPQRALPRPRDGRMADFLFVEHGRRLHPARLRRGLAGAVRTAGLVGPDGAALRVVPHQLRHTYATRLANAGMSIQALMALLGHRSPDMTLRYASLASPTLRQSYEEAMGKVRRRLPMVAPAGRPAVPGRVEWLASEMLKTRVAHGYCSRELVAEACPYANICEGCESFIPAPEFIPALDAQLADIRTLLEDAEGRGWESEAARHARVIASLEHHLRRLKNSNDSGAFA